MNNETISQLDEDLNPSGDDYTITVDRQSGHNKKVQLQNLPGVSGNSLNTSSTAQAKTGALTVPLYDSGGKENNVKAYGALGNGVNDDTSAIQDALNLAGVGGKVTLPAGTYRTSAPLMIPPYVTFEGVHGNVIITSNFGTVIKPLSSWAQGSLPGAVIVICDQTTGGYNTASNEQVVGNIYIDQSGMGSAFADAIQVLGNVNGGELHHIQVYKSTGGGINQVHNSSGGPGSWRINHILTQACAFSGFTHIMNDTTYFDCVSLGDGLTGAGGPYAGWTINGGGNNKWIACRAEWAGQDGFNIHQSTSFNLAPTMLFSGCSTDRNSHNGFYLTGTAKTAVNVTGCYFHRDGRNAGSGGGSYACVHVDGYAGSVAFTGVTTAPGVDDNGSGVDSPQYGLSVTGTNGSVMWNGGVIHAFTTAINNTGSNSFYFISPGTTTATGADSNPTYAPIQQVLATGAGHNVDDVITALQNLGLARQS